MPSPSPEALALAERLALALPERLPRGAAGERLGRGTGASLEFQDRRDYVAGDDLRHLDWRAYARTDQLLVRQYREEIQPRCEVLLDASRSMASDDAKAALAVDVAALLALAARRDGTPTRLVSLGDAPEPVDLDRFEREGVEPDGALPVEEAARRATPLLRGGALRYVVSDFLTPHDAKSLVRGLARGVGRLVLVQVLSAEDAAPARGVARRLVDAETDEVLDLVLDDAAVDRYLTRLARLTEALAEETRRAAGELVTVVAGSSLTDIATGPMVREGVLVPRSG